MSKRKSAEMPSKAGNVGSPDKPAQPRPWTAEEMASAKPLPLPTVGPEGAENITHAGKGQTRAAGLPESVQEKP